MTRRKRLLQASFYVVYGSVFAGWLFHRTPHPSVFKYNVPYVLFLLAMSSIFFLPWLVSRTLRRLGRKEATFAFAAVLLALLVLQVVASQVYYLSRRHDFDPFLQMPGPTFDDVSVEKGSGAFRIVAVGGSTTRCARLSAEDRYPRQLEELLRRRYPRKRVEVLNAGMDWWTTKHSLINYVTYVRRWKVDLLVVMHAINDAYRSFSPPRFAVGPYDERWSHYYGPAIQGARPASFEGWFFRRMARWWYSDLRIRSRDFSLEAFVSLPMFRFYLAELVRSAQEDGVHVLVVTQPSLFKGEMSAEELGALQMGRSFFLRRESYFRQTYPSSVSLGRALEAYNSAAVEVARARGARWLAAAEKMPRDLDHFLDDVHYTPQGAKRLAELVTDAVVDAGYLETD